MQMLDNIKKILIYFTVIIFFVLILIKYSISFLTNEILNILKSDKFDTFIENVIDDKLNKLSKSNISEEKKILYKNKIKIIKEKYGDIFQ